MRNQIRIGLQEATVLTSVQVRAAAEATAAEAEATAAEAEATAAEAEATAAVMAAATEAAGARKEPAASTGGGFVVQSTCA
jgi:hypothetical protein